MTPAFSALVLAASDRTSQARVKACEARCRSVGVETIARKLATAACTADLERAGVGPVGSGRVGVHRP
jgi:hypothetical protein